MSEDEPKFLPGQLIRHRLFGYRGVIVETHSNFQASDDWYEQVARTRPPKDKPWYQVLVHNATHQTYVAERNLEADPSGEPIRHPLLHFFFTELVDGRYRVGGMVN